MCEASFFFLLTLVVGIQVAAGEEVVTVHNFAEFQEKLASSGNVVLIVTAEHCKPCPPVLEQVKDNCRRRPNVQCYAADIGNYKMANSFYDAQILNIAYIPYVVFFKDGRKICAANQKWADKNSKNVNAGFRIYK